MTQKDEQDDDGVYARALKPFTKYFVKNYTGPTVISRPEWHAAKILRAAQESLNDARDAELASLRASVEHQDQFWKARLLVLMGHKGKLQTELATLREGVGNLARSYTETAQMIGDPYKLYGLFQDFIKAVESRARQSVQEGR